MLAKFNTGLDSYLSKDQVKALAPVAFATAPTSDKVSKDYLLVNTETIIDDLEKLGWLPVTASQRKARKSEKATIFSKHMVSFQNPDLMIKGKNGDDAFPRIILTNSHDGFNSFQFRIGIYRLVCSNGLVVADEEFSAFRIRHTGYTFEELRGVVAQAVADLPNKVMILNQMQLRELSPVEQRNVIPNACQNPIGLIPSTAPTKALFQSHCVGQANKTAVTTATPKAAITANPTFSTIIIRFLVFLLMNLLLCILN